MCYHFVHNTNTKIIFRKVFVHNFVGFQGSKKKMVDQNGMEKSTFILYSKHNKSQKFINIVIIIILIINNYIIIINNKMIIS